MSRTSLLLALLACPCAIYAQQAPSPPEFPRFPPLEPDQAAKSFECQHGFSMQLVAAEPLLTDPVDLAYDEDGRAYVACMRDYPFPEEKNAEPKEFIGQVRLLTDDDGDGRMDRSTVFADKLAWPTAVACWKGGVFVGAAPDIWYFKDTDADGIADVREKVFTGFSRYNVQAIMNNLEWGLDGRLYGAASGNGGSVRPAGDEQAMPIAVTRRDFSFDPDKREFRVESGGERFGNSFDDWGNRFLCNIRNPVQHVVLPAKYLSRNPLLAVPRAVHDAAAFGDQLRVYRISPPEPWRTFRAQRWALARENMPRSELIGAGFWTSSSGITIYRGNAYGPEFRGNAFIGEVA
ncbi:MAG: PVC-type heme-binding CxxCH protein, partial [Pirellulaceae bacterium]